MMNWKACDPWEWWKMFSDTGCCGWSRRFYTREERIARLEHLKQELEKEIAGVDEAIRDLRTGSARHPSGSV